MIGDLLKEADEKMGEEQWQIAIDILTQAYEKDSKNLDVLEKRAHAFYKLNRLADSVNDYNSYLQLNPENEELRARKELVQTILKNSQLDIYGCTNTHLDPWN